MYPSTHSQSFEKNHIFFSSLIEDPFHRCSLTLHVLQSGTIHFKYVQVQMGQTTQQNLQTTVNKYDFIFHQELLHISILCWCLDFLIQFTHACGEFMCLLAINQKGKEHVYWIAYYNIRRKTHFLHYAVGISTWWLRILV
jgi:hypothetical protein